MDKINSKKIFYIILFLLLIGSFIFYLYALNKSTGFIDYDELLVKTNKQEYNSGEKAIITIENTSDKKACFSSCYPFYVQIQDQSKKFYQYEECPFEDVANVCIEPNDKKSFQIDLKEQRILSAPDSYRFVISACLSCNLGESFKKEEFFFSNEFKVD
ncbi:MAG: hypothetical protein PHD93_03600 [Candidatus Pacebacteria bacterium]|nr:hypothetical protein [Candidatus Paceibacterota bacterium]